MSEDQIETLESEDNIDSNEIVLQQVHEVLERHESNKMAVFIKSLLDENKFKVHCISVMK